MEQNDDQSPQVLSLDTKNSMDLLRLRYPGSEHIGHDGVYYRGQMGTSRQKKGRLTFRVLGGQRSHIYRMISPLRKRCVSYVALWCLASDNLKASSLFNIYQTNDCCPRATFPSFASLFCSLSHLNNHSHSSSSGAIDRGRCTARVQYIIDLSPI